MHNNPVEGVALRVDNGGVRQENINFRVRTKFMENKLTRVRARHAIRATSPLSNLSLDFLVFRLWIIDNFVKFAPNGKNLTFSEPSERAGFRNGREPRISRPGGWFTNVYSRNDRVSSRSFDTRRQMRCRFGFGRTRDCVGINQLISCIIFWTGKYGKRGTIIQTTRVVASVECHLDYLI